MNRPSEANRVDMRIKGEARCQICGVPAGHAGCSHLLEDEVFERIRDAFADLPRRVLLAEKWGISVEIDPPGAGFTKDDRLVLPKGEEANYHYRYSNGWELHIRKNDHSGYAYTFHYEPGARLFLKHIASMVARDHIDTKETFGLYSRYTEPEDLFL